MDFGPLPGSAFYAGGLPSVNPKRPSPGSRRAASKTRAGESTSRQVISSSTRTSSVACPTPTRRCWSPRKCRCIRQFSPGASYNAARHSHRSLRMRLGLLLGLLLPTWALADDATRTHAEAFWKNNVRKQTGKLLPSRRSRFSQSAPPMRRCSNR